MPQIDPGFTKEQWEILWSLLYNATTNNAFLNRETGQIELNPEDGSGGHILDPLSLEEIVELDKMQDALWEALGRDKK